MADGFTRRLPDGGEFSKKRWEDVRKRAIASKDHVCAICGKPIEDGLGMYDPMSMSVDHIVPIARGGDPYDIDNLQLAHRKCNMQKGVKMGQDYKDLKDNDLCPLSNAW